VDRKKLEEEITLELKRRLSSKSVMPTDVLRVQVVIGGDHGNTAFQFGTSVHIELSDDPIIDLDVSICKLIYLKDTGLLLEETILHVINKWPRNHFYISITFIYRR